MFFKRVGYLDSSESDYLEDSDVEPAFWKRFWFSDENEIRFVLRRPQSGTTEEILKATRERLPLGERISSDLGLLIKEIVLNPFASSEQQRSLRAAIEQFQPTLLDRIRRSAITSTL